MTFEIVLWVILLVLSFVPAIWLWKKRKKSLIPEGRQKNAYERITFGYVALSMIGGASVLLVFSIIFFIIMAAEQGKSRGILFFITVTIWCFYYGILKLQQYLLDKRKNIFSFILSTSVFLLSVWQWLELTKGLANI